MKKEIKRKLISKAKRQKAKIDNTKIVKGIVVFKIPVGVMTSQQISEYMGKVIKDFDTDKLKRSGYMSYFLPIRADGSGPDIKVIKL